MKIRHAIAGGSRRGHAGVARGVVLLVAAALLGGCRSLAPVGTTSGREFELNRDDVRLSEALAYFSLGLSQESLLDGAALTNYLRAAVLAPEREELYFRVAAQHLRRGENDQAVAVIETACRQNPRSVDARLYLSRIYQLLKAADKAERACRQAIELAPRNYKGYIQLAALYGDQGDEARAVATLEENVARVDAPLMLVRLLGDLYARKVKTPSGEVQPDALHKAIAYYEQAARQPHDDLSVDYLHHLADLYILGRKMEEAIQYLNMVAAHRPDDAQVQKKIALCHMALGDKAQAVEALQAIRRQEPRNVEVHLYLGELYEALGDATNAAASFTAACETTPPNPKPYLMLALLHMRAGEPEKARLAIEAGLKRMPEDTHLLTLMAQLYMKNEQSDLALSTYERIEDILSKSDAVNPSSRFFLEFGFAAQKSRRIGKAIALYEKAIAADPHALDPYVRLAFLYMNAGRRQEALQVMEKAVRNLPDEAIDAYYYLGLMNSRAERFPAAVEAFEKAEALAAETPTAELDAEFFFNYGAACERAGEGRRAEALLRRAIHLDGSLADAFNYLAYMWAEAGVQLDLAREYVLQALELEPDNGAYLDTLGWIYFKSGAYAPALEEIRNALYFMPDDPTIAEHLGDIHAALGQTPEAMAWWTRGFLKNPDHQALADKLRRHGADVDALRRAAPPKKEPDAMDMMPDE